MTDVPDAPDAEEILRAIRLRRAVLVPLVEEHARLEQALTAMDEALAKVPERRALAVVAQPLSEPELAQEAPYGYKADGTPRRRRPPQDPDYARRGWETRRQARAA